MKFSERLKIIKSRVDFLKTHDKSYKGVRYTFKGTAKIEEMREFEQKYNVILPDEYIDFITTLGKGVSYGDGIFSPELTLEQIGDLIESESDLQDKFPFNNADAKAIIEKGILNRKYFGEFIEFVPGCLLVDTDGLGYMSALLILNGEQKGKIWRRDEFGRLTPFYKVISAGYEQMSFLDFYEDWIEHVFKWLNYDPDEEPENLNDIKYLAFKENDLKQIPSYVFKCNNLEKLYAYNTNIEEIPKEIVTLENLEYLGIEYSQISALPENIGELKKLRYIHMLKNNIPLIPESLFMLNSLEILDLRCNKLTNIPEIIDKLKTLKELDLYKNNLKELPSSIGNISTLEKLNISDNDLYDLPESFSQLHRLKELSLSSNERLKISKVLHILCGLKSLEMLTVSETQKDVELKLDNVRITTIMD